MLSLAPDVATAATNASDVNYTAVQYFVCKFVSLVSSYAVVGASSLMFM